MDYVITEHGMPVRQRARPFIDIAHASLPAIGRAAPLVMLALACASGSIRSDPGTGSARGTVRDAEGRLLAGAKVTLVPEAGLAAGPPAVSTSADGSWSVAGLAAGRWAITIDATGQVIARGRVVVAASHRGTPVEVRLRSLDEVTASDAEGNPAVVADWLLVGDSFLRDGRTAPARAEYEKALRALPIRDRPAVYESIARSWFVEREHDRALASLRRAARIDPRDARIRDLFLEYSAEQGRAEEAREFLAGLPTDSGVPPDEEAPAPPEAAPPAPELARPIDAPVPHRVGGYRTSFAERSPLGSLEEVSRRLGVSREQVLAEDPSAAGYDPARATFDVYVPPEYRAGEPYGLLVWISPGSTGGTERPEIRTVLAGRRLIWIGANEAGNRRPRWDRIALALDAAQGMKRRYTLDSHRIYVGGYSGGGRVASACALLYADVFEGGLFVRGADYDRDLPVPDSPGSVWPARFAVPSGALRRRSAREHRFVFLSGTRDFNRAASRAVYEAMIRDGFRRTTLLEIPGATHEAPIDPAWLDRALAALD